MTERSRDERHPLPDATVEGLRAAEMAGMDAVAEYAEGHSFAAIWDELEPVTVEAPALGIGGTYRVLPDERETPPGTIKRLALNGIFIYSAPDPDLEPELHEAWMDRRHNLNED